MRKITCLVFVLGSLLPLHVRGVTVTWANTAGSTAWYTAGNWSPSTASAAWTTSDLAQFANAGTATTAGINMGTASLSIGAVEVTSVRTRALTIGNSSATVGTLTLNGTTVNSVANVVLRNASSSTFTLQNNETGSGKTMNIALGNATDNIIAADGAIIISSVISGNNRKLTKTGTANLTLSGANTYSGLTTVNGGRFTVNGSIAAASSVTINSGGTLSGTGTVNGETTIASSGALSPGANVATIGTLTVATNLILSAGSSSFFAVDTDTLTCDKVIGISNLTCGGTLEISHNGTGLGFVLGAEVQLFSAGSFSGSFSAIIVPPPLTGGSGLVWDTSTVHTDGKIRLVIAHPLAYQTLYWTNGSGGDLNWSAATNWVAPANSAYTGSAETNALPTAVTEVLFSTLYPGTNAQGLVNSIVDTDITIRNAFFNPTNPFYHTILINPGKTLTVLDTVTADSQDKFGMRISGTLFTNSLSDVTVKGAGTVIVGNPSSPTVDDGMRIHMNSTNMSPTVLGPYMATLDLSGLDNFKFALGSMRLGANGGSAAHGALILAKTNLLIVSATGNAVNTGLVLGEGSLTTVGNNDSVGRLKLGQENVIRVNRFRVGGARGVGSVEFQAGLVNPTLQVRSEDGLGGPANAIYIGDNNFTPNISAANYSGTSTGRVDLVGGVVDVWAQSILVGRNSGNTSRGGGGHGTLIWSAGKISITGNIDIGKQGTDNVGTSTGVVTVLTNAVLETSTIRIGSDAGAAAGTGIGTLNIVYGGRVTVTNTILEDVGTSGSSTINLTNGFLASGAIAVDNVNVMGSSVISNYNPVTAGVLRGDGKVLGPTTVVGQLAPGASIGTLTVTSNLTLNATCASVFEVNVDTLEHDMVVGISNLVIGGTLFVSPTGVGTAITNGASAKIFDAVSYSGSFAAIVPSAPGPHLLWNTSQLTVNGTVSIVCSGTFAATNVIYQRNAGMPLKIDISQLLSNVNATATLVGVGTDGFNLTSTNGAALATNATFITYTNSANVDDRFFYTVNYAGCTATGTILIQTVSTAVGGYAQNIINNGSSITVDFSGIPGYEYVIERAENVGFSLNPTNLSTNVAGANGQFSITDPSPPSPNAFYRLKYNP